MEYVLVGGSNHDDGTYDGFWTINYEAGYAKLTSDDSNWLEQDGYTIVRYDDDLESYLEEQGCKNIVENDESFTFEV